MWRLACYLTFCFLLTHVPVFGQNATEVKGRIFDQTNGEPIPGVNVVIQGDRQQAITTDDNGQFKVNAPKWPDSLKAKAKGYLPVKISLPQNERLLKGIRIGLTTKSSRTLNEVVISGYPKNQSSANVPGNISLIDEKTLKKESDHTLARAMDQTPGLHYQQGAYGTGRMTIRGIGSRSPYSTTKIKAYYQQIPITSGEGISNLMDLNPASFSRLEVIKGPISSVYGSGLGGAVLLKPKNGLGRGTRLKLGGEGGSHGYWESQAKFGHVTHEKNIYLDYTRTHLDGFRGNSQYDRHNATFTANIYTGNNSALNLLGNFTHLKSFIPSSLSRETFNKNPEKADEDWKEAKGHEEYDKTIFGASYETRILPDLKTTTAVFTHYKNNHEPRPFNILKDQRFSYGARHLTTYSPEIFGMKTSWTLGGEYFNEWYQRQTFKNLNRNLGAILTNSEQKRQYWNLFINGELAVTEKLSLSAGVNYNQTFYRLNDLLIPDSVNFGSPAYNNADGSGEYRFDPTWSPRGGVNYEIHPRHNLFASVSSGFSQPSVQETLDPAGALNPDIKPETGLSYEIGGRGYIKALKLSYDLSAYHMQVRNKLVARRVGPDQYIGLNAGSTVHNGVEITLEGGNWLNKQHGWFPEITPFISYNYQDFRFEEFIVENENGTTDYSGNELTGTAPHHLTAGLNTKIWVSQYLTRPNALTFRFNYRYRAQMPVLDDNSIYTDPYHLLNARLAYTHHFKGLTLEAFIAERNITDKLYAAMIVPNAPGYGGSPRYYYPGEPRTLRFGLKAEINLD